MTIPIVEGKPLPGMTLIASLGARSKQDPKDWGILVGLHAKKSGITLLHMTKGPFGTIEAWGTYPAKTEDHLPLLWKNRSGVGLGTITGCSCGWKPKTGPARMSTSVNAHMAHLRSVQAPPRDSWADARYAEGAAKGMTWNEWYASPLRTPTSHPFDGC